MFILGVETPVMNRTLGFLLIFVVLLLSTNTMITEFDTIATDHPNNTLCVYLAGISDYLLPILNFSLLGAVLISAYYEGS